MMEVQQKQGKPRRLRTPPSHCDNEHNSHVGISTGASAFELAEVGEWHVGESYTVSQKMTASSRRIACTLGELITHLMSNSVQLSPRLVVK